MKKKNIIIISAALLLTVLCGLGIKYKLNNADLVIEDNATVINTEKPKQSSNKQNKSKENLKNSSSKQNLKKVSIEKSDDFIKKTDIGSSDSPLPLSAITIISSLSDSVKDKVNAISQTKNIYLLQKNNDKLLIVTDNSDNIRHGIEFNEINISNGHQTTTILGYSDKMQDSDNDKWEYDQNTKLPLKHIKYNSEGDMEFIEVWNYDKDEPIKYEMKDADGNVISLRKETLDDDSSLRVEHLIYDKNGNTKVNVSATYDGNDVKRFTYYNADKKSEGGAVYSEYSEEGFKTKETVYNSGLKIINSYTSQYNDGDRENIIMYDDKNNEIKKFESDKSN